MGITDITDITTQILSKTRIPKTHGFCMVCQHFCNHPSMISFRILFQHLPTKKEIGPHQTDDLMAWFCGVKFLTNLAPCIGNPRKLKGNPGFSPPHLRPTRHGKVVNKAPFVAYPFLRRLTLANNSKQVFSVFFQKIQRWTSVMTHFWPPSVWCHNSQMPTTPWYS